MSQASDYYSVNSDISDARSTMLDVQDDCTPPWKVSATRTECEEHTPFAEFAWSVQQLCKEFWPRSYQDITITRLNGGSFNRIIGLSVKPSVAPSRVTFSTFSKGQHGSPEVSTENYILRVSRDDESDLSHQIANLFYVQTHTTLPVPRILTFDLGSDNSLERPYTLQQRIPGVPLNTVIKDLTFSQRMDLVREIANIVKQTQSVESSVAGKLGFPKRTRRTIPSLSDSGAGSPATQQEQVLLKEKLALMTVGLSKEKAATENAFDEEKTKIDIVDTLQVLHFDLNTAFSTDDPYNGVVNTIKSSRGRSVLFFLNFQLVRHMLQNLENCPGDIVRVSIYRQLMQVVSEMDEELFLGEDVFNLFHGDLEPRNIMVYICDVGKLHVSGIIDWDLTAFVPRAVSCLAPRWVWRHDGNLDSHEREGEEDPTDTEQMALKQAFDNLVGDDFVEMAYEPQFALLRRLFRLAISGLVYTEHFTAAQSILDEWLKLKESLRTPESDKGESDQDEFVKA